MARQISTAKYPEHAAAVEKHILPLRNIDRQSIDKFLTSQPIPAAQKKILFEAPTHVWKRAASQTNPVGSYKTGLSPNATVPHFHMGSTAMYILKHGVDKVSQMGQKIADKRESKLVKKAINEAGFAPTSGGLAFSNTEGTDTPTSREAVGSSTTAFSNTDESPVKATKATAPAPKAAAFSESNSAVDKAVKASGQPVSYNPLDIFNDRSK